MDHEDCADRDVVDDVRDRERETDAARLPGELTLEPALAHALAVGRRHARDLGDVRVAARLDDSRQIVRAPRAQPNQVVAERRLGVVERHSTSVAGRPLARGRPASRQDAFSTKGASTMSQPVS